MRTLQNIIEEVDSLVPNPFDNNKKIMWLNAINKEFFEFVKIPAVITLFTEAGRSVYPVPPDLHSRNVDQVQVGGAFYRNARYEDVNPEHNQWLADEKKKEIQLIPPPYVHGLRIAIRYAASWKSTFTTSGLTSSPDAPEEYHDAYVYGLCERVAKAMNDVTMANNYGSDYREAILSAQQTYGMTPVTSGGVE